MGDPDLHSDEKILLTTRDVFVKSIPFEAVLTNKRIILIDRKKNLIPPKDILLATIRDIDGGENAIRDLIITLSLITSTGETRQLVLTFSRTAGGGRKRERDEWLKVLKDQTSSSIQKAMRKVVPSFDEEKMIKPKEQASPKIEITNRPAVKKEIEVAQPMKKIVETGNIPRKPVETSSLPTGSFCNRCGNRVPPESVFCNHCGAKVIGQESEIPGQGPVVPQISVESHPLPEKLMVPERKERPVDKEIQSIEPLIEGSVPRTFEAPPVDSSRSVEKPAETPASAESAIALAAQSIIDAAKATQETESASAPAAGVPAEASPATVQAGDRKRSIFPEIFPKKGLPQPPVPAGSLPTPPPVGGSGSKRGTMITIAVAVIVIIVLAGGAFMVWNTLNGGGAGNGETEPAKTEETTPVTTTPTPAPLPTTATEVPTTEVTPVPTTQVSIPQQGVWVRVNYPGIFKGTVGTAAGPEEVRDTGDKFYIIATSEGIVQAAIQKVDGSGDELVVEIYKNGSLVKRGTTTVPKGIVEVQADLKPKTTAVPTRTATTIPTANVTTVGTTVPGTTATTSP